MSNNLTPLAIYIHWPFCKAKCPYCDFNSHVRGTVDHGAWRKAYDIELKNLFRLLGPNRQITSIFFGGGTPSLMDAQSVADIIDTAQGLWRFANDIEITLEANPTSTENSKLEAFKDAGVNRVSIGIQALNDQDLAALGREHSAQEAMEAIALAQKHFNRFSFDLIYTRQNQTRQNWRQELTHALALTQCGHLSLYQLTIEPNTQFQTLFDSGRLTLPNDDESAGFYNDTMDIMERAGMPAYEISNYARQDEQSRHNLTYWRYGDYAGIGPGAHGRLNVPTGYVERQEKRSAWADKHIPLTTRNAEIYPTTRIATRAHKAPEEWLKRRLNNPLDDAHVTAICAQGAVQTLFDRCDALSPQDQFEEMVMMGLRLYNGLDLGAVRSKLGLNAPREAFNQAQFKMLQEHGFIHFDKQSDILRVQKRAMPVLNSVTSALLS